MCNICWAVGQSQLHQSYFCLNFHPSKNIWSQFFRLHQNEAPSGINQFRISTMKLNEHQKHEGFRYKLHQWKQVLRPGKWRTISLKKPRHLWIVSGICRLAWFYASPQIPVMKGLFVMPQCTPLYKPKATWGYVESIHRLTEWKSGFFEEFWDFWNVPTLDCVIGMKLVIPIFHTEFDALKVSNNRFGEIPPYGDFGDFLAVYNFHLISLVKFAKIASRKSPK